MINNSKINPSDFIISTNVHEQTLERVSILEEKIAKLSALCQELNPYEPIDEQFKLRLKELNILEFEDPFKITNALLILLEDAIDELHIYKSVDPKEKFR